MSHQILINLAMNCHACGKYALAGMHQASDGYCYHPACCVDCAPRAPLEGGQAKAAGEQVEMWEGGAK